MKREVYFDNSATTPITLAVFEEMTPYLFDDQGMYYNPSARYRGGREVKVAIENAREKVASLINADPNEIYFTSGGTESDNWAVEIAMSPEIRGGIVTSEVEHPALYNKITDSEMFNNGELLVAFLGVDKEGFVSLDELKEIAEAWEEVGNDIGFASVMMANNEVGTIQPVGEIAEYVHSRCGYFHTDAVQAAGNIPIDVKELGIDMLSMSSHKINGPKGVGALYVEKTVPKKPLIFGGGQEYGMRSGTENVASIIGFGKACELAKDNLQRHIQRMSSMRNRFFMDLCAAIPNVHLIGTNDMSKRLPGNLSVAFEGVEAESLLMMLDNEGVYCSVGSACSSNKLSPPRVLEAMKVPKEIIHSVVRFSFGESNTKDEIPYAVKRIKECVELLRGL